MGIYTLGLYHKIKTNKVPLVMDRAVSHNETDFVIDITSSSEASPSNSNFGTPVNESNSRQYADVPSISVSTSTNNVGNNVRNMSFSRRESSGVQRSPLNTGYWVFTELVITVSQIIAAVVVLYISRHEHPQAPLFTWVIGYASGCVATLPLLFWRFHNRNQDPSQPRQTNILLNARLKVFFEYFKMGLDCFFAVWFVVGNIWIFGSHTSFSDAPNLYRLCIIFLTFCCIGYAMPFILCATICCCLPCIISVMGFREDPTNNRGATTESINSLPTYKFKVKKKKHTNGKEPNLGASEGGVVAAGTEKEHIISGEDAVCSICLAKYANNDELRELPCSHFFHKNCVGKWLKINASCPLCKSRVGESTSASQIEVTAS